MRVPKKEWTTLQNRLEYLKDKTSEQERKIISMKAGNIEIQTAVGLILKQVALLYGGEDHTITLQRRDDLDQWDETVSRDPETGETTITLKKREGG